MAHILWSTGASAATSACFTVSPSQLHLTSSAPQAAASIAEASATTARATARQSFCLFAISEILAQVSIEEEAALWAPDWAQHLGTALDCCAQRLQQAQRVQDAPLFSNGSPPCLKSSGRALEMAGQAAYHTAVQLAAVAESCLLAAGCSAGGGATTLLEALNRFLGCPPRIFDQETLQPAQFVNDLFDSVAIRVLLAAGEAATALARSITREAVNARQAPLQTLCTVCQTPRALLQLAALGTLLTSRLSELHPGGEQRFVPSIR